MMKRFSIFILIVCGFYSCEDDSSFSIFEILDAPVTGLSFSNNLTNTAEFNILSYLYFYNGGGVAIGDINNDGLPDIYLCGNQVSDKLFLNEGDFKFKDVSHFIPAGDLSGWSTGVTMVDINNDGFLDIYVCRLGDFKSLKDSNRLFININGESFKESAQAYGLDFSGLCTQSVFFDYDRDGDLDCYLLNHSIKDPSQFKPSAIRNLRDSIAGDRLYENIDNNFVDVTESAGIYSSSIGFGLGIDVSDVNNDGWLDIYVGNDFHEQDYLYINQGDKTFVESIESTTGHTSNFSMGCGIADLNNDLKSDIVTMDMKAPGYLDYKKSGGWESMQIYDYKRSFGYHHQSPKNSLQYNLGNRNSLPQFSELSSYYKTSSTDWSWSPLIHDFDNDGDKDLFITNGIQFRPNDLDFIKFHFSDSKKDDLSKLDMMPSGLVQNCYFSNDLVNEVFEERFVGELNATTGAAAADLNLDGKLDIVWNEVNGSAKVIKNNFSTGNDYLQVALNDKSKNRNGLGSKVVIYQDGLIQSQEIKTSTGFMSCGESVAHFGLSSKPIDSLMIYWADGFQQLMLNIDEKRGSRTSIERSDLISKSLNIASNNRIHSVPGFISQIKSSKNQISEKWLLYEPECTHDLLFPIDSNSCFIVNDDRKSLSVFDFTTKYVNEITVKELRDDVKFISAGVSEQGQYFLLTQSKIIQSDKSVRYETELHAVDNNFELLKTEKLGITKDISKSKVVVQDYNHDNYLDVVVGGEYIRGQYGVAGKTILYKNRSTFFDEIELLSDDLVYDLTFSNIDSDVELELIVVGHWFPITIFDNISAKPIKYEIPNSSGLWFCVKADDFDNDGNIELFAGNFGLNHDLDIGYNKPLKLYHNDFDRNGQFESLVTFENNREEVPYFGHETFIDQLPIIKRDFIKASDFAEANISDIIEETKLENSRVKEIVELRSSFFELSAGNWQRQNSTHELLKFPVTNCDYNSDVIYLSGNIDEIDPNLGKQDAGYILALDAKDKSLKNAELKIPIERKMIWDAILSQTDFYYLGRNDSLYYFQLD